MKSLVGIGIGGEVFEYSPLAVVEALVVVAIVAYLMGYFFVYKYGETIQDKMTIRQTVGIVLASIVEFIAIVKVGIGLTEIAGSILTTFVGFILATMMLGLIYWVIINIACNKRVAHNKRVARLH